MIEESGELLEGEKTAKSRGTRIQGLLDEETTKRNDCKRRKARADQTDQKDREFERIIKKEAVTVVNEKTEKVYIAIAFESQ
jgi:pimeloyl-CoA synthetase